MSILSFLKPKPDPIPPETRCQHRYDNRSRCRLSIDEASEFFCHRHLDSGQLPEPPMTPEQREAQLQELYREVMGGAKYLNSACRRLKLFSSPRSADEFRPRRNQQHLLP